MLKFFFLTFFSLSLYAQTSSANEALVLWQKRDVKESLEAALKKFEEAHRGNPKDLEIIVFIIRGYFTLADAHTTDNEMKKKYLEKGRDFGMQGLKTNEEFKKLLDKGEDVEDAVKVLTEKEAAVTFWTAASLGRWARANGILASIKYKGQILEMVKRVEKLKPDYFHGAVPRYWGSYYGVIPRIAGKDLNKSKKYFEQSIRMAPEYLATKVLMAEIYCVEKGDKKKFKQLLNEVINDENTYAELIPENNLEKRKARQLLEKADDLF